MSILDKIIQWSIFGNRWLWFHMGGGAVGANIGMRFLSEWQTFSIMVILILLWEVFEFIKDGGVTGMIVIYGSLERWFYDSLGDVVGGIAMLALVVYR